MFVQYVTFSLTLIIGLACIIGVTYLYANQLNWEIPELIVKFTNKHSHLLRICKHRIFRDDRPTKERRKSKYLTEDVHSFGKGIFRIHRQWKVNEYLYEIRTNEASGVLSMSQSYCKRIQKLIIHIPLVSWATNGEKFEKPIMNTKTQSDVDNQLRFICDDSNASPHLSCRTWFNIRMFEVNQKFRKFCFFPQKNPRVNLKNFLETELI